MPKINGTYVSLHENSDNYPYYKGELEFRDTLCLAGHFDKKGSADSSDSYDFRILPDEEDNKPDKQKTRIEAVVCGMLPDKALFFTESNSAHHLTYFYVKEAAKRVAPEEKLLVVNFDQHEDTGSETSRFYYGSWGGLNICGAAGCDYLAVGPKYLERTNFSSLAEYMEYKRQTAGQQRPAYMAKLFTRDGAVIRCATENLSEVYSRYSKIYVTVDMDVLTCGEDARRTNWSSGYMTLETLRERLTELPSEKLIAADITGFPPADSYKLENHRELIGSYIDDILNVSAALCERMGIQPVIE